jgi:hypothetical protein
MADDKAWADTDDVTKGLCNQHTGWRAKPELAAPGGALHRSTFDDRGSQGGDKKMELLRGLRPP